MKKKVLLVLTILLALGQGAFAYDFSAVAPSGQTLYYNIVDGHAEVVRPMGGRHYNDYVSGDLVVPATVIYNGTTYDVTALASLPSILQSWGTFYGCSTLTSVTLPSSIVSIGEYAFYQCSNLISVNIPNGVSSIGNRTFYECSSLTSISLPNSVTSIGEYAFSGCSNLVSINIPNLISSISSRTFKDCSHLNSIVLPNSVTSIEVSSFEGCWSLSSINIPESVTSIGILSFSGCHALSSIAIPRFVNYIGAKAFYDCTNLDTVFFNADSCVSVYVGSAGLNSAPAFNGCTNLSRIIFGNTVKYISDYLCDGLANIDSIVIPNSVRTIGSCAFRDCTGLTYINIPDSVTLIDNSAFSGCYGLTSVTIGNSVKKIGYRAFYNCTNLTYHLTMGNSVDTIGESAFYGCHLFDVKIPSAVRSIGESAFSSSYGPFYFRGINPPSISSYNSVFQTGVLIYVPCESVELYRTSSGWSSGAAYIRGEPYISYSFASNNQEYGYINRDSTIYGCDSIVITVSAVNRQGYHLVGWSDGGTNNVRTLYITHDTNVIAIFEKNSYNILTGSNDSSRGNVTHTGSNLYLDTSVVFATPNYGYHFSSWSDGETANPRTLIITQDTSFTAIFDKNAYSLLLVSNSSVFGSVSGGGSFEYLDNLTFIATPNYGYHFTHWSDGNTDNPRSFTLTQDTSFTAIFAKNVYSITANSGNTTMGSVSGNGTPEYLDTISLTATANYGYHFSMWNDGVTDNPRQVQVTRDSVFTAQFDYNQYTISLGVDTAIHGTTSGAGIFNYHTLSTISASANYGYHFTHWSDGNTDNPRSLTLTQDTSFTAIFAKNVYSITANSGNTTMGSVSSNGTPEYLDTISLTATANYGYHFTNWSDGVTDNPRQVQVTRDSVFTAQFDYNQYTISLGIDTAIHGTTSGAGIFNYLTPATISASANYGYHFTSWSDGNTDNPRIISLTQDTSFTAYFEKNSYAVTVLSNNDTMGQAAGGDTVLYLDSITISATSNYGYHFTHWQDNNTDNPRIVQVTQNKTYTAYFGYDQFTLTVQSDNTTQGNVSGGGNYNYLSNRTITATPTYGHHFTYWNDGVTENPRTITLTQDTSFTAHFAPNQYTLTVNAGEHGTVAGSGTYNFGDTITIQAIPDDHYHFIRWNDGNTENPRQYRIEDDITLTAFFVIDTYTVSVVSSDIIRGMVEASGTEFVYGTPCTVTATAYTGYTFAGWSNGVTANPYTFAVISDVELTALFVEEGEEVYTVTVESADPTMGTVSGGGQALNGGTLTIRAIPNDGYQFRCWNDGNTENPRTVTVTGNITYTAYFESTQGIGDIDATEIKIYATGGRIVVQGAEGMETRVFDLMGREVVRPNQNGETPVLPSGVYLVKVGTLPARKVVVMR